MYTMSEQVIHHRIDALENQVRDLHRKQEEDLKWRYVVQKWISQTFDFSVHKQLQRPDFLNFNYEPPSACELLGKNIQTAPQLHSLFRRQQEEFSRVLQYINMNQLNISNANLGRSTHPHSHPHPIPIPKPNQCFPNNPSHNPNIMNLGSQQQKSSNPAHIQNQNQLRRKSFDNAAPAKRTLPMQMPASLVSSFVPPAEPMYHSGAFPVPTNIVPAPNSSLISNMDRFPSRNQNQAPPFVPGSAPRPQPAFSPQGPSRLLTSPEVEVIAVNHHDRQVSQSPSHPHPNPRFQTHTHSVSSGPGSNNSNSNHSNSNLSPAHSQHSLSGNSSLSKAPSTSSESNRADQSNSNFSHFINDLSRMGDPVNQNSNSNMNLIPISNQSLGAPNNPNFLPTSARMDPYRCNQCHLIFPNKHAADLHFEAIHSFPSQSSYMATNYQNHGNFPHNPNQNTSHSHLQRPPLVPGQVPVPGSMVNPNSNPNPRLISRSGPRSKVDQLQKRHSSSSLPLSSMGPNLNVNHPYMNTVSMSQQQLQQQQHQQLQQQQHQQLQQQQHQQLQQQQHQQLQQQQHQQLQQQQHQQQLQQQQQPLHGNMPSTIPVVQMALTDQGRSAEDGSSENSSFIKIVSIHSGGKRYVPKESAIQSQNQNQGNPSHHRKRRKNVVLDEITLSDDDDDDHQRQNQSQSPNVDGHNVITSENLNLPSTSESRDINGSSVSRQELIPESPTQSQRQSPRSTSTSAASTDNVLNQYSNILPDSRSRLNIRSRSPTRDHGHVHIHSPAPDSSSRINFSNLNNGRISASPEQQQQQQLGNVPSSSSNVSPIAQHLASAEPEPILVVPEINLYTSALELEEGNCNSNSYPNSNSNPNSDLHNAAEDMIPSTSGCRSRSRSRSPSSTSSPPLPRIHIRNFDDYDPGNMDNNFNDNDNDVDVQIDGSRNSSNYLNPISVPEPDSISVSHSDSMLTRGREPADAYLAVMDSDEVEQVMDFKPCVNIL